MMDTHDQRGFTLIEIMIALTIFAVGVLAVAALQGTGLRAATKSEGMTQSKAGAKSRMERLLGASFDALELQDRDGDGRNGLGDTGFDNDENTPADADHGPSPDEGTFRVYWNVADDEPQAGLKTIQVIALWREKEAVRTTRLTFVKSPAF